MNNPDSTGGKQKTMLFFLPTSLANPLWLFFSVPWMKPLADCIAFLAILGNKRMFSCFQVLNNPVQWNIKTLNSHAIENISPPSFLLRWNQDLQGWCLSFFSLSHVILPPTCWLQFRSLYRFGAGVKEKHNGQEQSLMNTVLIWVCPFPNASSFLLGNHFGFSGEAPP